LKRKCEDIPILADYTVDPPESFWRNFPSCELPKTVEHTIDVNALENLLQEFESKLTYFEMQRAVRCVNSCKVGAPSFQKTYLPPCQVKNAKVTYNYGPEITDTIAIWTIKGFLAGPFDSPPLKDFRVNGLKAIDHGEKVRPVLNVSLPVNESFNDNINVFSMEKVYMSNARKFGHSLCDAGKNSLMSKYDLVDAYKNIPAPMQDLRLQGLSWLNKYFIETRQIFGAKTAVANFDILGNTILAIVCAKTEIPKQLVHRTLDDVPIISPEGRSWSYQFDKCYKETCENIGVKIAQNCEKNEKAFMSVKNGKVLGIKFDTQTLCWSLPQDKKEKALRCIKETLNAKNLKIVDFQILMGRLNDIAQMCEFLKGFKFSLNKCLSFSEGKNYVTISHQARNDLAVWKNFLLDSDVWIPICPQYCYPPIGSPIFCSDAAGWAENMADKGKVGCGNVGFDFEGKIIFAHQLLWNSEVLQMARDSQEKRLGDKTTSLEFLGMLLPFIMIPEMLCNKYVIVKVDNVGCYYGWINKQIPGDEIASILVRSLHLICAFLGCQVHVEHLPRRKTWEADLVDRLSRERSTNWNDRALLRSFGTKRLPDCLSEWMKAPSQDWGLADGLLKHVIKIVGK